MSDILTVQNITKAFPGVLALSNVTLSVGAGEVHGVVGENGAGKSTLMHIIAGVYKPDSGTIVFNGEPYSPKNERDAQIAGVGMVFQERSLVNELSIAENVFAGRQPTGLFNVVLRKEMEARTVEILKRVDLDLDPSLPVSSLSPIKKQLVEIAKALSLDAKMVILDEPTATITEREVDTLFALVRKLKEEGISIVYISHRLQELPKICDRVTILKDGSYQGTFDMDRISLDEIVAKMVGREISQEYTDRGWRGGEVVFEVENLSSRRFSDVSFALHSQEILGIAGLAGAGRTELALAIFGADPNATGTMKLGGKTVDIRSPREAIEHGIGYLTEDRKELGLFLDLDVSSNIVSANLGQFTRYGYISDARIEAVVKENVRDLGIATSSTKKKAIHLSGGNQQKLLLARWLLNKAKILIIDEPTVGVDVGAKQEIYDLIRRVAQEGTSVIVISSDLPEILTISDRIMVMWLGRKTGELSHAEATEERIMRLASGMEE